LCCGMQNWNLYLLSYSGFKSRSSFSMTLYILIMKANEMHCFSHLFDKGLYMFLHLVRFHYKNWSLICPFV
jgi:hypothetical protein